MTISAAGVARVSYAGNGVTVAFTTPVFIANSDIKAIKVTDATGAETPLTETTHYTLAGGSGATGTLTMLTAPATDETLVIYVDPAVSQEVDLVNGDPLDVNTEIEQPLDKLTLIVRRVKDLIDRALRLPDGDTGFVAADLQLPAKVNRASKYLGFDANGKPIATAGTTSIPTVSAFMATVLDDANAAAALTTLGVSAFIQTLLDDANAAAARATLGAIAAGDAIAFTGNNSHAGTEDFASQVKLSGDISPSQITTDQNDYNPTGLSTASILRLNTDSNGGLGRALTGLAGGGDGRIVTVINVGSNLLTLKDDNAGSTAANRFALPGDVVLLADESVELWYDSTSSRWRPKSRIEGINQTYQNMTGSRDITGTVFRNTTGKTIKAYVTLQNVGANGDATFYCDATATPSTAVGRSGTASMGAATVVDMVTFEIPHLFYYSASKTGNTTLEAWRELR